MGEGGIPDPEGDPARPLSDLEKRLFGGVQPPPVSASLAEFARDQVARAALRFKGFCQDYERVNSAATAQWKAGLITHVRMAWRNDARNRGARTVGCQPRFERGSAHAD